MASIAFARHLLVLAGRQWQNRNLRVVKRAPRQQFENAHGDARVWGVGSVTVPDFRYSGPSNRMVEDDPHQACYAVCEVDRLLSANPQWGGCFVHIYGRELYPGRFRHEESEMAKALAEQLGEVEEERTIVAESVREWRLRRMRERRDYDASRKRAEYAKARDAA